MLRILFKIFAVAFVVAGASGYAAYLKTGRLPWQGLSWSPPQVKIGKPAVPLPGSDAGDDRPIYKWRDEDGGWVYSNSKPPDGVEFDIVAVDPQANIMKPVTTSEPEQTAAPQALAANEHGDKDASQNPAEQPALYSPEGVKKLMDDAKNVQNVINEQARKQHEMINQL